MEIQLAWGSLLKIVGLGVLAYVISPLLMTARDSVLWWAINKVILNNKLTKVIHEYAFDKSWLDCADLFPFRVLGNGEEQKFYLNQEEVTMEMWLYQKKHWEKVTEKVSQQGAYLKSAEQRLDRILKYYKQDDLNPIREQKDSLYSSWCKSYEKEIPVPLESQT